MYLLSPYQACLFHGCQNSSFQDHGKGQSPKLNDDRPSRCFSQTECLFIVLRKVVQYESLIKLLAVQHII